MLRVDETPGRLRLVSRTPPPWLIGLLVATHVALFAFIGVVVSRAWRVARLECSRATAACERIIDGRPDARIPLDGLASAAVGSDRSRERATLVLVHASGDRHFVVGGLRPERAAQDAAEVGRFLAGTGPDPLWLEWDRRWVLAATAFGVPGVMVLGLLAFLRRTTCTVDRIVRTVAVRTFRRRSARLDDFTAAEIQTVAEANAERADALRVRWGRFGGLLLPRSDPKGQTVRRIVLRDRGGKSFPVTAWVIGKEDLASAGERLRTFLPGWGRLDRP